MTDPNDKIMAVPAAATKLVECPRDAMQGWKEFIPTRQKANYINALLQVGFDTIDFGSFVSAKAIPQLADTKEVISKLQLNGSRSSLLAIVANLRGAEEACAFEEIRYIGFPFSISPTFQLRNTNSTIEESLQRVEQIQELCLRNNKLLVIYLSMGFGNPYGDPYSAEVLLRWADEMVQREVSVISLADTVGLATPEQISFALDTLIPLYPATSFGVHLHSTPSNWEEKMQAAVNAGCKRFDGALRGVGGCPMAGDALVGNMSTELMAGWLEQRNLLPPMNKEAFRHCLQMAGELFSGH